MFDGSPASLRGLTELADVYGASDLFLDPDDDGTCVVRLRIDGAVFSGPRFGQDQYGQILTALRRSAAAGARDLEAIIPDGTGGYSRAAAVQATRGTTLSMRRYRYPVEGIGLPSGWPKPALDTIERMRSHPNGLMLFSHRGYSTSRYDPMPRVFDHLAGMPGTRVALVTDSTHVAPWPGAPVTHFLVEGAPASWAKALADVVHQDYTLIGIRGHDEKVVLSEAVRTALEDRMVLTDVSLHGAADTLAWALRGLDVDAAQVAEVLLGVIALYGGACGACPHCATRLSEDAVAALIPAWAGITSVGPGHWVQCAGCEACRGGGYDHRRRYAVCETVYVDRTLAMFCATAPSRREVVAELAARGFETILQDALKLARAGHVSVAEALRVGLARRADL